MEGEGTQKKWWHEAVQVKRFSRVRKWSAVKNVARMCPLALTMKKPRMTPVTQFRWGHESRNQVTLG